MDADFQKSESWVEALRGVDSPDLMKLAPWIDIEPLVVLKGVLECSGLLSEVRLPPCC